MKIIRLIHTCAFLCLLLATSIAFTSCKEDTPKPKQDGMIAGNAAAEYYKSLLRHDYKTFVGGTYFEKPIPQSYRALLEKNAQMYLHEQDSVRGGIKKVVVSKANIMKNDSTLAAVYLQITFGNKESEQILVPMVKRKGVWYMK